MVFSLGSAWAQVPMSSGAYSQDFDTLADSGTVNWTNNFTLPGWYAAKGSSDAPTYIASTGSSFSGSIYSFGADGVNSASDRALGSIASSGNAYAYGVRLVNNTTYAATNITISYTGEQWRNANGSSAVTNTLSFSYQIANTPLTDADAADTQTWTPVSALDFNSPIVGGSGTALDGNDAANRQVFTNIVLTGVVVEPGEEMFLRWRDPDDTGSDAGMAIDDLTVSFETTAAISNAPVITAQPQSQATGEGGLAVFSAGATGDPAPHFQWLFNNTNLPGAISPTLTLSNVTAEQAGNYSLLVTNSAGSTSSDVVSLIVTPDSIAATNGEIRYLTYNVNGNGVADWSTNSTQVQAIGRELIYFNPDIVTFNEIPYTNTFQMVNWVKAYLPGFYLATNSVTDGYIRSVIASRFPIQRSQSWMAHTNLSYFGYSGTFSRDLFEAQIAVSNYPAPLHVFIAHLKATTTTPQSDADRRAAETSAISNFFVNVYLPGTNGSDPYILSGDMNEDAFFPDTDYISGHPIQRMTAAPTGLYLTTPVNPFPIWPTNTYTESIRSPLDTRFDYILPCAAMFTNIAACEVFRTDLLTNFPPDLFSNDDKVASDHLPVVMIFKNPFDTPFKLLSAGVTNQTVSLSWESQNNRNYSIESSSNLTTWQPFATDLMTTNSNPVFTFKTNFTGGAKFFRIYRMP